MPKSLWIACVVAGSSFASDLHAQAPRFAMRTVPLNDGTAGVLSGAGVIASGDWDHDGSVDFAIHRPETGLTSFRRGDGLGAFETVGSQISAFGSAAQLVTGEFTGDGIDDLAAVRVNPNVLVIVPGAAGTGFGAPISIGLAHPFQQLAVADFDGDGVDDLAACRTEGVEVFTHLAGAVTTTFMPAPFAWISYAGDFTGDGHADLLVLGIFSFRALAVGDGAGGFAPLTDVVFAPGNPGGIASSGDVDGDGRLELATLSVNAAAVTFTLWHIQANAIPVVVATLVSSFTKAEMQTYPVPTVRIADLSGDGRGDVVFAGAQSWRWFESFGNGSFAPERVETGPWVDASYFADFDADGMSDMLGYAGTTYVAARRLATPGFGRFQLPTETVTGQAAGRPAIADFDADGAADIVGGMTDGANFSYRLVTWARDPTGAFAIVAGNALPAWMYDSASASPCDVDDDGFVDVVLDFYEAGIMVLRNDGAGAFLPPVEISRHDSWVSGACVVDGDLDGDADLFVQQVGSVVAFANDGAGVFMKSAVTTTWIAPPVPQTGSVFYPEAMSVADHDGDGIPDLAHGGGIGVATSGIVAHRGNGDLSFGAPKYTPLGWNSLWSMQSGDLDGDGRAELVTVNVLDGLPPSLVTASADSHGALVAVHALPLQTTMSWEHDVRLADANADGILDAIVSDGSAFEVACGKGDGSFAAAASFFGPAQASAVGDVDGDGDVDVVAQGHVTFQDAGPTCSAHPKAYGVGCAGTIGPLAPTLVALGCAKQGGVVTLRASPVIGGAHAFAVFGNAKATTALGGSCSLLVGGLASFMLPIAVTGNGALGGIAEVGIPVPAAAVGVSCFVQVFVIAPATGGFAATNGVAIVTQ